MKDLRRLRHWFAVLLTVCALLIADAATHQAMAQNAAEDETAATTGSEAAAGTDASVDTADATSTPPTAKQPSVVSSSLSENLAKAVADQLKPYDPGFPFETYTNSDKSIHIKYPEGWHVWESESNAGGHLFITREPMAAMDDLYLAGIHLTQSSPEVLNNLSWIDFSNPKQAANQWLTALELASEGQLKLLSAKRVPVGERTGFFSAWLFSPNEGEGYPISTLRISVFDENYFSEIVFECPAVEYEQLVPVFVGIIEDPKFSFE